ncbi:hypothetical protein ACFFMP_19400 [Pseudoroseomonas cervicalis]|uniref:Uncharacterized protein n=1 Tax=Pseudoroseomonas cervicalis ATCC 49957 TaxID=525371 RepID=D5RUH7_9PROT|nr:hypothetical protein [Pseudoroseomonas cervicalis]EFH09042.1 hypothetical protein HMPREF0731_4739 [Pseudoroseomonas cervicalis ATCC 49957]
MAEQDSKQKPQAPETEKDLDKALKDSFPASDPPSTAQPGSATGWEPAEKKTPG